MRLCITSLLLLAILSTACRDKAADSAEYSSSKSEISTGKNLNQLQFETSPYLLQHATNPVDWLPWSEAALERARREDKPIIVSIGYSTCHWCHVMEKESFMDQEVADFMNAHFVNIKVDREERPDVDQVYMEACQAITGNGGWPLNTFLLPDTRPFHAGTYFPVKSDGNRPGWLDLLKSIASRWETQRGELISRAEQLTQGILANKALLVENANGAQALPPALADQMVATLAADFDDLNGGFGSAPKFPSVQSLELLLDHALMTKDNELEGRVHQAAKAMIAGGIYDQLAGGFSRYTVDEKWRIPHFEKMLYDNALLLRLLGKLHLIDPQPIYQTTIAETIGWLEREMKSPQGSFYAALNADSEGREGAFYVWTPAEIEQALKADELTFLDRHFSFAPLEDEQTAAANVLYRTEQILPSSQSQWTSIRAKLLKVRSQRERPSRDEKIILQWNALLISGLSYAYRATGEANYLDLATNCYKALEKQLYQSGRWYRTYTAGQLGQNAYLNDLAAINNARLDLYDLTLDPDLLLQTEQSLQGIMDTFGGAPGGLYYLVPAAATDLAVTPLDIYDNALPSGNSQLIEVMLRLSAYTGKITYRNLAREKISVLASKIVDYPANFANFGRQLLLLQQAERNLVVSGPQAREVVRELLQSYRPGLAITLVSGERDDIPTMLDRYHENELQLYLCENQTCKRPVGSIQALDW